MATPSNPANNQARDPKKETIYIDVDDEITTIIEKLQNSQQRIVALVLPKRAAVMQSVVNMKLLKRSAEKAGKNVVLITSEQGLLPLAGAVGLHVANTLQSKPAIPPAPDRIEREHVVDEATGEEFDDFDPETAAEQPIGQLAGLSGAAGAAAAGGAYAEEETIDLDNTDPVPAAVGAGAAAGSVKAGKAAKAPKKGKNKSLKIPNFNKFRLILIFGILAVLLLGVGFLYANFALAKATVTLQTNSSDVATKASLTLDPSTTQLDLESDTLPAKIASKQLTGSQQVSTSGQKNNGTKASGEVTMSSQVCGASIATAESPADVPAGTGVSSAGKTFITQQRTAFSDSGTFKSGCVTFPATDTTDVTAQSAGADFNIAAASFSVAGRSDVTAKSSTAFSGGTDNIVKVVAQSDIDSAKQKIASQDKDNSSVKDDLTKKLSALGYTAISGSLNAGDPTVTPSAAVGDQADTVTVSQATNYTMYGVKEADIKYVITANVKKQIDPTKQQILKDGYDTAKYSISSPVSSGELQVAFSATSLAGPDVQPAKLAAELGGLKTGAVKNKVTEIPGVSDASVKYSPFWISTVPKKAAKVTIVIEKATGQTKDDSNQ